MHKPSHHIQLRLAPRHSGCHCRDFRPIMAKWWRSAGTNLRWAVLSGTKSESFPFSSFQAAYHTIQAVPRECSGRKISSKDRAQGRIPAVVFSQQLLEKNPVHGSPSRKHLLTTERKQIHSILKSVKLPFFCSTRFQLQIRAGSGSSVLLESGSILPIKVSHSRIPTCLFMFHSSWFFLFHFLLWSNCLRFFRFIGTKKPGRSSILCLYGLMKARS